MPCPVCPKRPVYISNVTGRNKVANEVDSPGIPIRSAWFGLDVDGVVEEIVAIVFWRQEVGA